VAGTPKDLLHGLRHNRDEALPAHSSRLPLLHSSAMLGFWKHLGPFKFGILHKYLTRDFQQPQSGGGLKPLMPSVIIGS
jgi:hypothetical protein